MNSATAAQLLSINRRFYLERGDDFADTRQRIQPGVRRVMQSVRAEDTILDLGCGSGALAGTLSQGGHRGRYLGLDLSPGALERARLGHYGFPATFLEAELDAPDQVQFHVQAQSDGRMAEYWALVLAFAVLHHLPGSNLRVQLLKQARSWVRPDGRLLMSNWQFSASSRMQSRIIPWSAAGLSSEEVDDGDYLVDWRRGGPGLRYVHEFREGELSELAVESGFCVKESFLSDGVDGHSGLYQIWRPT